MKPIHYLLPSLILVATCGVSPVASQITAASDGTGTVVIVNGDRFNINGGKQAGNNLFHSFDQFGLSQGQTANFQSNPNISNILGRVVGGNPSVINGLIQVSGANSNLYLINPVGILFGPNASLNVPGSFTATTANGVQVGDFWFRAMGANDYANLIGTPNAFAFTSNNPGAIVNAGNLAVPQGKSITLLGGTVINTGTLSAPGGTINIMAAEGEQLVEITPEGSLLSLALPVADSTSLTNGIQPLTPVSLPQLLTGGNLHHATGVEVSADGVIRLTNSGTGIPTQPGVAIASGTVDASGEVGGKVQVLGDVVGVVGGTIDVSGVNGGGTALIGGDYKGQGVVPNASRTFVSGDSVIKADGLVNGDGGRVIVWADGTAGFSGNISARGGSQSGDGGFVEVSGKENLIFRGNVDVGAVNGQSGSIFLDPENIIIGNSSNATISEKTLENTQGNITLEASNNFSIEDLANNILEFKNPSTTSITFTAGGNFLMNPNDTIFAPGKVVTIKAQNIVAGDINTADKNSPRPKTSTTPDDFVRDGEINLTAKNGDINAGILSATKKITLTGNNITAKGIEIIFVGFHHNPKPSPLSFLADDFYLSDEGLTVDTGLTVNATGTFQVTDIISRNITGAKNQKPEVQGSIILLDGVPEMFKNQDIGVETDPNNNTTFTLVGSTLIQVPKLNIQSVNSKPIELVILDSSNMPQLVIPNVIPSITGGISSFYRIPNPTNATGMVMFNANVSLANGANVSNPNGSIRSTQQLQGTNTVCNPNDTSKNGVISKKVGESKQPEQTVEESTQGLGICQVPTTRSSSLLQIEGY